jgi:hypothetical protein
MIYDDASKEAYRLSGMKDYTQTDYFQDIAKNAFYWNPLIGEAKFAINSSSLTTDLFESGVTKLLDTDNKPILFGTYNDDSIFGTQSRTHVDIGADNHPLNGLGTERHPVHRGRWE